MKSLGHPKNTHLSETMKIMISLKNILEERPGDLIFAIFFLGLGFANIRLALIDLDIHSFLISFNNLLTALLNFAVVYLFVVRQKPQKTSKIIETIISVFSYIVPFFINWIANFISFINTFQVYGIIIMPFGLFIVFFALFSLGKSFGVVPARRTIKTHGIYRIIRHPMYLGDLIMVLGNLLIYFNMIDIFIILIAFSTIILRIRWEEKILSEAPEYLNYKSKVKYKLFPFIW
jgi:protein-S-isoprenylcysteine O-methyltransferase Ste14